MVLGLNLCILIGKACHLAAGLLVKYPVLAPSSVVES